MLTISLFEPQIPPNTGNIARLCGANNIKLDLVGKLGFEINDRYLKRAGLDYWTHINWEYFSDIDDYCNNVFKSSFHLLTTKSKNLYTKRVYSENDYLIFGSETKGISEKILNAYPKTYEEFVDTKLVGEGGINMLTGKDRNFYLNDPERKARFEQELDRRAKQVVASRLQEEDLSLIHI